MEKNFKEKLSEKCSELTDEMQQQFEDYMMATGEMATDVGTILYGKEAVSSGLIDQLGGLSDALTELHAMIKSRKTQANQ